MAMDTETILFLKVETDMWMIAHNGLILIMMALVIMQVVQMEIIALM